MFFAINYFISSDIFKSVYIIISIYAYILIMPCLDVERDLLYHWVDM